MQYVFKSMKGYSMKISDIFDRPPSRGRKAKHPFSSMEIDQIVTIEDDAKKLQVYAHVYGRQAGMKFSTRVIDGVLYVKRIN